MNLTKNNIFYGIIGFLILVNILVFFNLNQFFIRATLSFIFIITIPGLLIMLMLKIREVGFWEYLVYTIGLSVSFIMFAGLAINWILPWLNITDKPLALIPILTSFNIFLLIFWLIAYIKNQDLKPLKINIPKLDNTNRIFFIIPMIFPILSILGALILNNHGPNYLTMIMFGGIAVYVLLITIFRNKLNENVYPWALYWMGLSLLLMYSLRSWYFMGNDIVSEYHFFELATQNGFWDIINYPLGYNVILSVNILPTILNIFSKVNPLIIFKLFIQLIFPIILIVLYLFFKKFSSPIFSFLAGFFFTSQIGYMVDMTSAIRQEIAFLAMSIIFLILFSKDLSSNIKNIMIILFGFTLIVSHYSTGYITLALFLIIYISVLLLSTIFKKDKFFIRKIKKVSLTFVLLLFVFGFLWYSQITPASNNIIDFTHNSLVNFNNLFKQDMQMQGQSFLDQFKLKPALKNKELMIQKEVDLIQNKTNRLNTYPVNKTQGFITQFVPQKIIPTKFSIGFSNIFYIFLSVVKKFGYIFIFIGLISSLIISKLKDNPELFLISLIGIIFFFFVVLITLIPFGSISYGTLRLYQQGLILFSVFAIIGVNLTFKKIKENYRFILIVLFLITYFFAFTGFFNQVVGGNLAFSNLNNFGGPYDTTYISSTEINSIKWLSNEKIRGKFYASRIYRSPFVSFGNLPYPDYNIFPKVLKKDSYVYAGNSEVFNEQAFSFIQGGSIGYNFPTKFLNNNKNKVYNNGGSEIFK